MNRSFFRLSPRLAGLTGLLLAIPIANVGPLAMDLLIPAGLLAAPLFLLPVGPMGMFGVLFAVFSLLLVPFSLAMAGCLGVQALRFSLVQRHDQAQTFVGLSALVLPAICFAAGLELGLMPWTGMPESAHDLAWNLFGNTATAWVWLALTYVMGSWVLGAWIGERAPRRLAHLTRLTSATLLVLLAWPIMLQNLFEALTRLLEMPLSSAETFSAFQSSLLVLVVSGIIAVLMAYGAVSHLLLRSGRTASCSRCGNAGPHKLGVEALCARCGAALAAWLHLKPVDLFSGIEP